MNNQEVLSQAPEMLNNRPARDFTVHIDRFGYIFRCDQYLIAMPFSFFFNSFEMF